MYHVSALGVDERMINVHYYNIIIIIIIINVVLVVKLYLVIWSDLIEVYQRARKDSPVNQLVKSG